MLDLSSLTRVNDDSITRNFVVTDGSVLTKQDCYFLIPFNYLTHKLAKTGEKIFIASIFAIVIGNKYSVCATSAWVEINPSSTNQVKLNGENFIAFQFVKGQTVMPTNIIVYSDLAYEMYKYFYVYGRVPWFLNYDDVSELMKYHKEYNGLNISPNNVPFEIISSKICRDVKNKFLYYRHGDMKKLPVVVPFNSVLYNATNTTSKLLGNYLADGVTSALINPSETTQSVENMLRA